MHLPVSNYSMLSKGCVTAAAVAAVMLLSGCGAVTIRVDRQTGVAQVQRKPPPPKAVAMCATVPLLPGESVRRIERDAGGSTFHLGDGSSIRIAGRGKPFVEGGELGVSRDGTQATCGSP